MESICLKTISTWVPFCKALPVRKKKGTSRKRSLSMKKAPEAKVSVVDSGLTLKLYYGKKYIFDRWFCQTCTGREWRNCFKSLPAWLNEALKYLGLSARMSFCKALFFIHSTRRGARWFCTISRRAKRLIIVATAFFNSNFSAKVICTLSMYWRFQYFKQQISKADGKSLNHFLPR